MSPPRSAAINVTWNILWLLWAVGTSPDVKFTSVTVTPPTGIVSNLPKAVAIVVPVIPTTGISSVTAPLKARRKLPPISAVPTTVLVAET